MPMDESAQGNEQAAQDQASAEQGQASAPPAAPPKARHRRHHHRRMGRKKRRALMYIFIDTVGVLVILMIWYFLDKQLNGISGIK